MKAVGDIGRSSIVAAARRWAKSSGLHCAAILVLAASSGCGERDALERVQALQSEGRWEESVELLRTLVDERPEDARLHLAYGKALLGTGDATRAIWPLRRAAETDELAQEAGVLLAMALLDSANADDAIAAASAVLARDPENEQALFARSRALVAAKREMEALADADLYVSLAPDDREARLLQIGILVMVDRVGEAEEAIADAAPLFLDEASENPGDAARFCVLEAVFHWEKGDQTGGSERLEACLDRFPDQPLVVTEVVAQHERAGDPARAVAVLRRAVERDPKRPEFRWMLAQRLSDQGEQAEAESILRDGTTLIEGPGPWLALHDHYVAVEDYAQARAAMERALENESEPPAALRIAYADDLILSGDLEAAQREVSKIEGPGRHLVLGRILLARGDAPAALAELEEGTRLWPDNPSARWLAGQAAERSGDFPRAIAHYREAVRTDASRTPAAAELAAIYAAMGAGRDALDFAMRNLQAQPTDPEAALLLIRLARRFDAPAGRATGLSALAAMPSQTDLSLAQQALERARTEGDVAAISQLEAAVPEWSLERLECLRVITELELRTGRSASAERRIAKLLEARPDSVDLLLLLADVQDSKSAPLVERRALLARASAAAPDDARIALRRARLELEDGNSTAALTLYDDIPESAEEYAEAVLAAIPLRRAAAESARREAESSTTIGRLEALLARDPRQARAAFELAQRLAEQDPRSDRALAWMRSAALLGGGVEASEGLGRLLVERGDPVSAIPVLEAAISSFPEAGRAPYWLGRARAQLGRSADDEVGVADRAGAEDAFEPGSNEASPARYDRSSTAEDETGANAE